MSLHIDAERILDAFLAPESDRLADRVIDAVLADIARTPQRRALRVPWRFARMPAFTRATGVAAVALVAVVAAGGLIYFNSHAPGGPGGPAAPTATLAPTTAPTASSPLGASGWPTYTSKVYGITFSYPDGWILNSAATRKWQAGDNLDFGPYTDVFTSADGEVGVWAFQVPAGSDADIGSREGLTAFVCGLGSECQTSSDDAESLCFGRVACLPAVLMPLQEGVLAYMADTETRMVTIVEIGREDSFPGTVQYGGSVQLMKAILTTMDVWTPEPGQIPSGG